MRGLRHIGSVGLLTSCLVVLVALESWAGERPHAHEGATEGVQFEDPRYISFFNYQAYLIKRGSAAETAESWKLLPASERVKRVAEGESFLDRLHAELLAKETLTADDRALLEAVWGSPVGSPRNHNFPGGERARVANHDSIANMAVGRFSGKVAAVKNWASVFDGGVRSADVGAVPASVGPVRTTESRVPPASNPAHRPLDSSFVPARGLEEGSGPAGTPLPVAVGTGMLVVAALGIRWMVRARRGEVPGDALASAKRGLESIGLGESHAANARELMQASENPAPLAEAEAAQNSTGCTSCSNTCSSSCTGGCQSGCSNSCKSVCGNTCSSSCGNSCSGDCQGNCKGGCALSCSGSCQGSCVGTCQGTCQGSCKATNVMA